MGSTDPNLFNKEKDVKTRTTIVTGVLAALLATVAALTYMMSPDNIQASDNCVAPLDLYDPDFDDCVKGIVNYRHDLEVTTGWDGQGGAVTVTVGGAGGLEQGADLRGWTVRNASFKLYIRAGVDYDGRKTARPGQPATFNNVPMGGRVYYYVEVILTPPSGTPGATSVDFFLSGKRSHSFRRPAPPPTPIDTPVPRADIETLRLTDRGQQNDTVHHYELHWTTGDGRQPDEYTISLVQLNTNCSRHATTHMVDGEQVGAHFPLPDWFEVTTSYKSWLHVEAGANNRWEYRVSPKYYERGSNYHNSFWASGDYTESVFTHSACGPQSIGSTSGSSNTQDAPTANSPATGKPTISGTAAAGQTLTASTAGIADPNGLSDARYTYQWSRGDGSTETDIPAATSSTYTVHNDDIGYQLSVTVSFTDDDGNQESLTSNAVYVQSPQPLYGGFDQDTVPDDHNGSTAFTFQIHFSEEPELSYVNVRDDVLTVTGGTVTGARRTTSGSDIRWEITLEPDGNDDVTVVLPPTTDCEEARAVCASGGKMLSNSASITVPGPD